LTFLFISKATPTLSKQPSQHLPSDRSGKKSKADEANCFVCEKEPDDETDGHEALFRSVKVTARAGFTDNVLYVCEL